MSKRVPFGPRPSVAKPVIPAPTEAAIDAWVYNQPTGSKEAVKRFTFEVPVSLHKRIKMACTLQDRQMAEVIRELLEKHFPPA